MAVLLAASASVVLLFCFCFLLFTYCDCECGVPSLEICCILFRSFVFYTHHTIEYMYVYGVILIN